MGAKLAYMSRAEISAVCSAICMGTRKRGRPSAVAVLLLLLLGSASCSLDDRPANGGLVVVVESDLAVPKDLEQVQVDVMLGAETFAHLDATLDGIGATLPREFRVPAAPAGKEQTPAWIRVTGWKAGQARIERSVITPIPTAYLGVLHVPLNVLCDGRLTTTGVSTCADGETCKQGRCDAALVATAIPDYLQQPGTSLRGVTTNDAGPAGGTCFDVRRCFKEATEVTPDLTTCSFPMVSLFNDRLNVALRYDLGHAGTCTESACWVVLDAGGEGFKQLGPNIVLPPGLCEANGLGGSLRVAVSQLCAPKTSDLPLCTMPATSDMPDVPISDVVTGMPQTVGDTCSGPGLRSCGQCGSSVRTCQSGLWSGYSECSDEGVCKPEATETCGNQGTRSCGGDCTWSGCDGQACDGPSTRACGNCGTQRRLCNNGQWAEWSACENQGACAPFDKQGCGANGAQACGGDCRWGACGDQSCSGAPSEPCGSRCGSHSRTCNNGVWSDWGLCIGEGDCAPNDMRACGSEGVQTCGGNCRWDATCTGQNCSGSPTQACGRCGTQARVCDMNSGRWSAWSACMGEGECTPDGTRACGSQGTQTCTGSCEWNDACTGQRCSGEASRACGDCGKQTRRCDTNTGAWLAWSACSSEGDCSPGQARACGAGGNQTCAADCQWDTTCPGQMCTGPNTEACGNCGTRSRTCDANTGRWSEWGMCTGQGMCTPGAFAQRMCGSFSGQTCNSQCQWAVCSCVGGYAACPNAGCVALDDDPRHCGRCDVACNAAQTCDDGECHCPNNTVLCGGRCLNTQTDASNCGKCGNVCGGGKSCQAGVCTCPTGETDCSGTCVDLGYDLQHCGSCANVCTQNNICAAGVCRCPPNTSACNGRCYDVTSDAQHCGTGCNVCPTGGACTRGVCGCPTGRAVCGGACVDTNTDASHCGPGCTACAPGGVCQAGQCGCPQGTGLCGGACVDTASDEAHCGANCAVCSPGASCTRGACACPAGQNVCGGVCTNTQTDAAHCGASCSVCMGGRTCQGGQCACPAGQNLCNGQCLNTQIDAKHCGAMCLECPAGAACTGGTCGCPAGQNVCSGACVNTT
ncbi:MAG: hypothetical protein RL701_7102, partial [Pseudomonadota bacterium]